MKNITNNKEVPSGAIRHSEPRGHQVWVIGSSAAGPSQLGKLLVDLPSQSKVSVVISQHISSGGFQQYKLFIKSACRGRGWSVVDSSETNTLRPGEILLQHPDHRIEFKGNGGFVVSKTLENQKFTPSIDYTIESVAQNYGGEVSVLTLSGMGNDGTVGIRKARKSITEVVTQSNAPVLSMPTSVHKSGLSDHHVTLEDAGKILFGKLAV